MALTPKQKRFVAEYLVDLNATAAAIRAGYSKNTAEVIGYENLRKPQIEIAINQAMQEREKRTEITQDMVLRETAKLAFFDIRKMFDKNGKPLDISQLDADTAAALVGLDVQDIATQDGDYMGCVKKYKMADKLKALELLGKHTGAFEKNDTQTAALETAMRALADIIEKPVPNRKIEEFEEDKQDG